MNTTGNLMGNGGARTQKHVDYQHIKYYPAIYSRVMPNLLVLGLLVRVFMIIVNFALKNGVNN